MSTRRILDVPAGFAPNGCEVLFVSIPIMRSSSFLSEFRDTSILRTRLPAAPSLSCRLVTGLAAHAPAQRAGAQRLCAVAQGCRLMPCSKSAAIWGHRPSYQQSSGQPVAPAVRPWELGGSPFVSTTRFETIVAQPAHPPPASLSAFGVSAASNPAI
jgi:hypothetical protein